MKIAVFGQYSHKNTQESVEALIKSATLKDSLLFIEKDFFNLLTEKKSTLSDNLNLRTFEKLDASYELLVTIGGDGTILRAITFVGDYGIPIVGINTGRLGFLATIRFDEIERALEHIFEKNYKISERTLLAVTTTPENEDIQKINYALNEVAVSRKNTTSMITVETHLDDEYLTSYWADGLIIATPTGSTGYSLSCGGPVITPADDSLVLTPIAPHNLSARPLVIPSETKITLKVSGREDQYLISLDSRIATLHNSATVTIKRANFRIKMIELPNETFIDTLRRKLLWGEDRRN
ncbi:NAD kinase [Aegicerativicinus sediminis]|uniref:NAD kinase n=1 Tax=Aegicerativicinus sediminis TaxID=2893202 RepID=UPI001E65A4B8|nr:NAD kinase [Aegicerativicinus sediminis]